MIRWLAALLLPLLAGCWVGGEFYSASEVRAVIPAGDYRMTAPLAGAERTPVRVAILPGNLTRIVPMGEDWNTPDDGDAMTLGIAPLSGQADRFVIWLTAFEGQPPRPPGGVYGLLLRERDGFRLVFPRCDDTRALAAEAGARVSAESEPVCEFPARASLERAFAALRLDGEAMAVAATLTPR